MIRLDFFNLPRFEPMTSGYKTRMLPGSLIAGHYRRTKKGGGGDGALLHLQNTILALDVMDLKKMGRFATPDSPTTMKAKKLHSSKQQKFADIFFHLI